MANQKDLVVKMTINSKDFENGLRKAKANVSGLGSFAKTAAASVAKFAGALGVAVSAGNLLIKNMREIETISDRIDSAQKVLNDSVKSMFTTINTNSFQGFIDGLKDVIKASKEAYEAIDNLGTYLDFSNADYAKNQAATAKAQYMIKAIDKGQVQGDIQFWKDELKRLQEEANGIISKEIAHYEEAIKKSNDVLFKKFQSNPNYNKWMDKYTGTADKNETAQARYNYLEAKRKEIAHLFGKGGIGIGSAGSTNSMYQDWMRSNGDELAFLEVVIKREKDINEKNKLITAQANKQTVLYNSMKTNLRYLGAEEDDNGGGSKSKGKETVEEENKMTEDQIIEYVTKGILNEVNNQLIEEFDAEWAHDAGYDMFTPIIDEEVIVEEETDRLIAKVNELTDNLMTVTSAISAIGSAFSALSNMSPESVFGKVTASLGEVVSQAAATISAMMALSGAETVEGLAETFSKAPFGTKLAMTATAMAGILAMIASVKNSFAGSFAEGGIVPGSSYSGDKLIARVNSGEMILNKAQQASMFGQSGNVRFVIEGSQLKGVLDNYNAIQTL